MNNWKTTLTYVSGKTALNGATTELDQTLRQVFFDSSIGLEVISVKFLKRDSGRVPVTYLFEVEFELNHSYAYNEVHEILIKKFQVQQLRGTKK